MNNVKTSKWVIAVHEKQNKNDKEPKRHVYCDNCKTVIADDIYNPNEVTKQSDLMSVDTFNEHKEWFKFCNRCGCYML